MPRKKGFPPTKSNYLRRRRIAQTAEDGARGVKDTERRSTPNDLPPPRKPERE